jgi:hypothetical protein
MKEIRCINKQVPKKAIDNINARIKAELEKGGHIPRLPPNDLIEASITISATHLYNRFEENYIGRDVINVCESAHYYFMKLGD